MTLPKITNFITEIKKTTPIDTSDWKEFRIGELFDCDTAKQLLKTKDGNFPQVNRSAFNNGITKYVKKVDEKVNLPNCITIGAEGFYAFYQDKSFMAGNKIYVLRNNKMNKYSGLFICSVLNSIVKNYSYNNARILNKIKEEVHKLPVDKNNEPDWKYMEDYMKNLIKEIESSLVG